MEFFKQLSKGHLMGIPAAPGLASGRVEIWNTKELSFPRSFDHIPEVERQRLQVARTKAKEEISSVEAKLAVNIKTGETDLFKAHKMFVDDVALLKNVDKLLFTGLNAEAGWMDAIEGFVGVQDLKNQNILDPQS